MTNSNESQNLTEDTSVGLDRRTSSKWGGAPMPYQIPHEERVKKKQLGIVNLLPKNNMGFFFNYSSFLRFHLFAILPPQERVIQAIWKSKTSEVAEPSPKREIKIKTPHLLLGKAYSQDWTASDSCIFEVDLTQTSFIKSKPYMISNVYKDGKICIGGSETHNIRKAEKVFFGGIFNTDIAPSFRVPFIHRWDEKKGYCKREHNIESHADIHHHIHQEYFCKCEDPRLEDGSTFRQSRCVILCLDCWAPRLKDKDFINDKARFCPCCIEECNCFCDCKCCNNTCECPCQCDLSEEYFKWIEEFNTPLSWKDITPQVCGLRDHTDCQCVICPYCESRSCVCNWPNKPRVDISCKETPRKRFVSYFGTDCIGVFYSEKEELMSLLPSKLRKKRLNEDKEFVVGIVKEKSKNYSEVFFTPKHSLLIKKDQFHYL